MKIWREHALAKIGQELAEWTVRCATGQRAGLWLESGKSTYVSPGFNKTGVKSSDLDLKLDFFIEGVTECLGFEEVSVRSAKEKRDVLIIDVQAEDKRSASQ